jgi:hypothetical protein
MKKKLQPVVLEYLLVSYLDLDEIFITLQEQGKQSNTFFNIKQSNILHLRKR